jgi:hypothetical protein
MPRPPATGDTKAERDTLAGATAAAGDDGMRLASGFIGGPSLNN